LVPFFWQTAPFVFLAASARTGIVSLWFHERSFPAAFPLGRNRSVWMSRARLLQRNVAKAAAVLDHFVKIGRFLPGVLSFDACRVNFFWIFLWRGVPEIP